MFCAECGKEIADHAPVCPECGTAQTLQGGTADKEAPDAAGNGGTDITQENGGAEGHEGAPDKAKPAKKKMPKRILVIAVAAVALAILAAAAVVILRGGFSSKNFGKASDDVVFSFSTYADQAHTGSKTLIIPEKTPDNAITLEGSQQRTFWNLDSSVCGVVLGDDQVLYRIEKGKEAFIEENVASVSFSANGKGLAFTTGAYRSDNTSRSDLYLRNGTKNERISRDCAGEAVFSPSGRYLLYTEYDGKNYTLLLHNGRKAKEILSSKRRISAVGIRDDGRRMYYAVKDANGEDLPGDYTLYHYDGETFEELGGFSYGSRILLNRDLSQILFVKEKNAWFSENGQEPVKLRMGGSELRLVTPYLAAVQYADSTLEPDVYDVKDFRNTYVICDDTLYLFTGDEFKALSRKVLDAQVLQNEKTLLIRRSDGGLYRMNGRKENAKEEELATDDIDLYGASADGRTIYYITKNAELYLVKKKGEPQKLSGEKGVDAYVDPGTGRISHLGQIAYREKSGQLFFVEDGKLYVSAKEGEVTEPSFGTEGNVTGVTCFRDVLEITTVADGVQRVYLSTDGAAVTLLDEGYLSE